MCILCGFFVVFLWIVRSEQEYRFNLSNVARTEKVLTAELHLFKLRPQSSVTFNRHHFCQVNISWIRSEGKYQTTTSIQSPDEESYLFEPNQYFFIFPFRSASIRCLISRKRTPRWTESCCPLDSSPSTQTDGKCLPLPKL